MSTPALNRKARYGVVVNDPRGAAFYQNGIYYSGDGRALYGNDGQPFGHQPPPANTTGTGSAGKEPGAGSAEQDGDPVLEAILAKSIGEVREAAEALKAQLVADGTAVEFEPLKGNNQDAKRKNAEFIAAHVERAQVGDEGEQDAPPAE